MPELILQGTATADWQKLVQEAAQSASHELDEELESYLVWLLARTMREVDALQRVMALDYLEGLLAGGRVRTVKLQDVGDHCLLLAGLFPKRAERRRVRVSYFVDLGRAAYRELSEALSESTARLYRELAHTFVSLMDVLQAMRELNGTPCLSPLEATELWQDTRSRHARSVLGLYSDAIPVLETPGGKH